VHARRLLHVHQPPRRRAVHKRRPEHAAAGDEVAGARGVDRDVLAELELVGGGLRAWGNELSQLGRVFKRAGRHSEYSCGALEQVV
jgi:hypothetical protein